MRILIFICLLVPLELIADGPDFSVSIDSHFHVVSPANWKSSRLAINGVIEKVFE